jgi:hypothetical protein
LTVDQRSQRTVRKERPPPLGFRRNSSVGQKPERASVPRFHWLLCDFQGPRRGVTRRAASRDRSPASGRRSAGLSKLNSMGNRRRGDSLPGPVDISSGRAVLRIAVAGRWKA